jgi:hypothetical protein
LVRGGVVCNNKLDPVQLIERHRLVSCSSVRFGGVLTDARGLQETKTSGSNNHPIFPLLPAPVTFLTYPDTDARSEPVNQQTRIPGTTENLWVRQGSVGSNRGEGGKGFRNLAWNG